MGDSESWIKKNPEWEYRFWTDDDLLAFFKVERPDLLELTFLIRAPFKGLTLLDVVFCRSLAVFMPM